MTIQLSGERSFLAFWSDTNFYVISYFFECKSDSKRIRNSGWNNSYKLCRIAAFSGSHSTLQIHPNPKVISSKLLILTITTLFKPKYPSLNSEFWKSDKTSWTKFEYWSVACFSNLRPGYQNKKNNSCLSCCWLPWLLSYKDAGNSSRRIRLRDFAVLERCFLHRSICSKGGRNHQNKRKGLALVQMSECSMRKKTSSQLAKRALIRYLEYAWPTNQSFPLSRVKGEKTKDRKVTSFSKSWNFSEESEDWSWMHHCWK